MLEHVHTYLHIYTYYILCKRTLFSLLLKNTPLRVSTVITSRALRVNAPFTAGLKRCWQFTIFDKVYSSNTLSTGPNLSKEEK